MKRDIYKVLSEKYSILKENDKEDIMSGINHILDTEVADLEAEKKINELLRQARTALTDLEHEVYNITHDPNISLLRALKILNYIYYSDILPDNIRNMLNKLWEEYGKENE